MQTDIREIGLLARLRDRTQALHLQAEKSGIISEILRGQGSRPGYALLLRNLAPVYEGLEAELEGRRDSPAIGPIARTQIFRSAAMRSDLSRLCGDDWRRTLPVLKSGELYAARIKAAAESDESSLIAHAYVRYMGDLNGGLILKRLLSRSLQLPASMLAFYDFPQIPDLDDFKTDYRDAFERAAQHIADPESVAEESAEAFRLNIALSIDVAAWVHSQEAAQQS